MSVTEENYDRGSSVTASNGQMTGLRQRIPRIDRPVKKRSVSGRRSSSSSRESSPCSSPARDARTEKTKVRTILQLLNADKVDKITLKQLAISRGGLVNSHVRRKAWHRLLEVDISDIPPAPAEEVLKSHRDYNQVVMDVDRSLKRFPPGMEESERLSMQDRLVNCIMRILVFKPELHYYQGFHDIVVTFLLVVDDDLAFALVCELCNRHLRDFMYENMDKTTGMLHYLYPLLGRCSSQLRKFMEKAEVGTIFSLPWLITWYGHVLNDIKPIVRLYDFFIACDPLMPIYLAAAIVLYREKDILNCEPEMPYIHCLLSKIPDDFPFEYLISRAGDLYIQNPPATLAVEAQAEHEKYIEANLQKQRRVEELRKARLARENSSKSFLWPFGSSSGAKPPSTMVRVTVALTGAVVVGAAALTMFSSYYRTTMSDFQWVWNNV